MTDVRATALPNRGHLAVAGPDARELLQGLLTNDLRRLAPDRALHAALLTAQGKYLVDMVLHDDGQGGIVLDVQADRLALLLQRLTLYRMRAAVTLEAQPDASVTVAVVGPGAANACGLPDSAGAALIDHGLLLAVDPRRAELGGRVLGPAEQVAAWLERAGIAPGPFATWDRTRIAWGVPDGTRDLVPEKTTLLEAGFDALDGVAFDKGCYVGQELTARTHYRGLLKRRLVPVQVLGPCPPAGTPVTADGRDAGELRSASGDVALALLRLDQLAGELRCGLATLRLRPPAWLDLAVATDTTAATPTITGPPAAPPR